MSVKRKIMVSTAALTLWGGVGVTGMLTANAATSACGTQCTNFFNVDLTGTFALATVTDDPAAGQPVQMLTAGPTQAEDFGLQSMAPVSEYVTAGIINPGLGALYGSLTAEEIQYEPDGVPTGLCVGVPHAPRSGTAVTLQPCGVSADTLWILYPVTTSAGSFDALISGAADRDFKHPQSMVASLAGDVSTDSLKVDKLPKGKANDELWATSVGPL